MEDLDTLARLAYSKQQTDLKEVQAIVEGLADATGVEEEKFAMLFQAEIDIDFLAQLPWKEPATAEEVREQFRSDVKEEKKKHSSLPQKLMGEVQCALVAIMREKYGRLVHLSDISLRSIFTSPAAKEQILLLTDEQRMQVKEELMHILALEAVTGMLTRAGMTFDRHIDSQEKIQREFMRVGLVDRVKAHLRNHP